LKFLKFAGTFLAALIKPKYKMAQSEFRKDIVSGEWVLVAGSLKKKPNFFEQKKPQLPPKKNCPFEDISSVEKKYKSDFVSVIPNKFPILTPHKTCPVPLAHGPYKKMNGVGFQEVVVTKDHARSVGYMNEAEIQEIIQSYIERYKSFKKEKCIEYILIFHNNGPTAGATVGHPHSQILALPIIPLDVSRSLNGSAEYFKREKKCAHCEIIKKELKDNKRIIAKNKDFVVLAPFASHVSFETRIYPLKHGSNFESISLNEEKSLAEIMRIIFSKIKNGMNDSDYNFFIHTAPVNSRDRHYHWHLEILPRTNIWGGLELGSGTEVVKVPPEEAAAILRKAKA
jgi:UDPglucose--hexose-1-phosphate uridylyltransferase